MEGYVTVKYKASSIRRWGRVRKLVFLPIYVGLIVISLVTLEPFFAVLGVVGLAYTTWNHFHWRKILKEVRDD